MKNVQFNYSKLRGRIVEVFDTQNNFANAMNISVGTLSAKLSNKSYFTADEIVKASELLHISSQETSSYFFCRKS